MSDIFDPIENSRPPQNYDSNGLTYETKTPTKASSGGGSNLPPKIGFANIKDLKRDLKLLDSELKVAREECLKILAKYCFIIPSDEEQYPEDTPDSVIAMDQAILAAYVQVCDEIDLTTRSYRVSYPMYLYLLKNHSSNAATYIRTVYEMAIRDAGGCNCLDIMSMLLIIQSEAERVKSFLIDFIGEINDTSEYRILENFQTWTEDARITVVKLRKTAKKEYTGSLPSAEVDSLKRKEAREFQAIFKIKLNVVNRNLVNDFTALAREYVQNSDYFYNKYLGKALKFRLKVGTSIIEIDKSPVLKAEAEQTITTLNAEFFAALTDQVKRNRLFRSKYKQLLDAMLVRDTYASYIFQLSNKGTRLKKRFVPTALTEDEEAFFAIDVDDYNVITELVSEKNFTKSHSLLEDLDDPDAHPQYLLKAGGELTGDITLADGVKVDGIVPSLHEHTGEDGSVKISGANIEYNSITDTNVDTSNSSTSVPENVLISKQEASMNSLGQSKVVVELGFDVDTTNIASYEFEIIKL